MPIDALIDVKEMIFDCSYHVNLRAMQGGVGIPAIRWAGSEGDYNVLVSVPEVLKISILELFIIFKC